jgi:glycine hydroxymethyltransferase
VHEICRVERVLELAHIALNKNTVPGDKSAMVPGGIRMGSPALTSRGFIEKDFEEVAEFVHRGVDIARDLKQKSGVFSPHWSCFSLFGNSFAFAMYVMQVSSKGNLLVQELVWYHAWICVGKKMSDFRALLSAELPESITSLAKDVESFAKQFPTIGFEKATMRYPEWATLFSAHVNSRDVVIASF